MRELKIRSYIVTITLPVDEPSLDVVKDIEAPDGAIIQVFETESHAKFGKLVHTSVGHGAM